MLRNIFDSTRAHILSSCTFIQDVYIYNSQDIVTKEHNPFPTPCIFVDFGDIEYQTRSIQQQVGIVTVTLKLAHESLAVNHLDVFDRADQINSYLNGWGDWGGQYDQIRETVDTNYDRLYIYDMVYTTSFRRDTFVPNQWTDIGTYGFNLQLSATTDAYVTLQTKSPTGYTFN